MAPCHKDLYTITGNWNCTSSSMACIVTRHVTHWARLGDVWQCVPVSAKIQQLPGTTFHRPQSTAGSTLCKGDVSRMRQMVTPDTDWFSDPCKGWIFSQNFTNESITFVPGNLGFHAKTGSVIQKHYKAYTVPTESIQTTRLSLQFGRLQPYCKMYYIVSPLINLHTIPHNDKAKTWF